MGLTTFREYPLVGCDSHSWTRRSGSGNGKGRSKTAFTTVKIAVFAPMPRASERTATPVKTGDRANIRRAKRRSATRFRMYFILSRGEKVTWKSGGVIERTLRRVEGCKAARTWSRVDSAQFLKGWGAP